MRRWKMKVLQTLQSPRSETTALNPLPDNELSSQSDPASDPSSSSSDRSSTAEYDLPGPSSSQQFFNPDDSRIEEGLICEGPASGRRFRALHRDASTDEEPIRRIFNVKVSRMNPEQEAALEAERRNPEAERNNQIEVNLSPTRIQQRQPGDSPNTIRFRMTVGGSGESGSGSSETESGTSGSSGNGSGFDSGFGSGSGGSSGGSEATVPPSKMRRIDFSAPPSAEEGTSGSLPRTNVGGRILEATQRRYGNVDGRRCCQNRAAMASNGANSSSAERPRLIPFHRRPSTVENFTRLSTDFEMGNRPSTFENSTRLSTGFETVHRPSRIEYDEIRLNHASPFGEERATNQNDLAENFTFLRPAPAAAQSRTMQSDFERVSRNRSTVLLGNRTVNFSESGGGAGGSNGAGGGYGSSSGVGAGNFYGSSNGAGGAFRRPSWLFEMRDRPGSSSSGSSSSVFGARNDFSNLMGEHRYPSPPPPPPPIIQPPPRLNRPVDLFAEDDEDSSSLYRAINRAIAGNLLFF